VFTAGIKLIALITEWELPNDTQQHVLYKANLFKVQELRFPDFTYSIFNEGVIEGTFCWILSITPLLRCVGVYVCSIWERGNFVWLS
jgi:hypothetical protein